jgi:hypothetical protein
MNSLPIPTTSVGAEPILLSPILLLTVDNAQATRIVDNRPPRELQGMKQILNHSFATFCTVSLRTFQSLCKDKLNGACILIDKYFEGSSST